MSQEMTTRMTAIHEDHSRDVLRFLLGLTRGERQTAEDLLQETMLRAWRHIESLPGDAEGVRKWLFTVARRLVIDVIRMRGSRPAEIGAIDLSWIAAAEDTTDIALATHSMGTAFRSLSSAHRHILSELYFLGRSTEEVAAGLGVPVGTVKSRSHYALRALKIGLS